MDIISIDDVAEVLDVSKSRIEQWISRNQFLPLLTLGRGKKREWDKAEVARLAVFIYLVDEVGIVPADAGRLTQIGVHLFRDDGAFFVCYKADSLIFPMAWSREIVKKSNIGNFLAHGCHMPKLLEAGYDEATIRRNSEPNLGSAKVAVLIDLDCIENTITENWPKS